MATILIIDDDELNRQYLVTLLGYGGHRMLEAGDGEAGLIQARAEHPDLVIADILMPTMDGYEFVRRLRDDPRVAGTPVIFYSAIYHEKEARALAEGCGVRHLITKPSDPEAILETVNEALRVPPAKLTVPADQFAREHSRLLSDKLSKSVGDLAAANARLKSLLDISRQLTSEREAAPLLHRLSTCAREVVGARYAGFSIFGPGGEVEMCLLAGFDAETASRIQARPCVSQTLVDVFNARQSVRTPNGAAAMPGLAPYLSGGSFLAVPMASASQTYGVLFFLERVGAAEFSQEDELAALALAGEAAVAYENALQWDALRASEERNRYLAELLDRSDQPFAMGYHDGRLGLANPAFERLTGYSRKELQTISWNAGLTPPEWRDVERVKLEELRRTSQPVRYEKEYLRKDGTRVPIELLVHLTNEGRDGPSYYAFITDLTERKRTEQALAASEARFRALLESAPEGVIAIDEHSRICLVNARTEELFGYRRDELLGQTMDFLLPERFRAAHREHERQYFARPRTRTLALGLDLWGRGKDGSEFPLEVSLSFVKEGETPLALALVTDITERKQAEEHLRQVQKLESIGVLAGGIAHDFNNLLVGVIGNASLAQDILPPGSPAAGLLDAIVRTGEQAAHLTRQMLAYAGKGRVVVELVNLADVLNEMSGLIQPSISKRIALHLDLGRDVLPVEADRGQLQQVFMNLVLNAAEAIGSDAGVVSVRTGVQMVDEQYIRRHLEKELRPGNYVFLEVRDTGCGMDEATRARIFDPFFSTKFQGRGLGLAAVAGILRGHKGAITVRSVLGQGACFTALFPVAESAVAAPAVVPRDVSLHGNGTILVVDDEQSVREVAKKALECYGYKVLSADGGVAAINVFKRHPGEISLVILDVSMPDMNGQETFPELRKIRPGVRVLLSSGYGEAETMRAFPSSGVAGFIQKPYTSRRLVEKVKVATG